MKLVHNDSALVVSCSLSLPLMENFSIQDCPRLLSAYFWCIVPFTCLAQSLAPPWDIENGDPHTRCFALCGPCPTVITLAIVCDIPAKTSASSFFSPREICLNPLLLSVTYVQSVAGNWRNFGFVIQQKWKWVTTMWNTPPDRICSVLMACALVDSSDWDSTDGSHQLHTDNWDTMSHHAISLEFKPK